MNSPRKPSGVHATVPARPRDPFGHQGKVLAGRYRLDALLGSGGMAEVYAATHLRLGMPLAVKVLRSSSATSPNLMDRFAQEAKATARLQHENIVRILDYGSEGPLAFIVMERLEGVTLSSRIDADGPPPLPTVRAILEQLCDALSAAHLAGVVHRDLKPANVMLVPAPGGGELIKVLDFGLARITEVGPSRLTQTGEVAGTPQYMSPEQCRSLDVGPATDIYALGCILTELLQGAPLFDSPAPVDVIAKHLFLPVPPLNRSKALPFVPAAVLALRRAMLAKEPEERPATAALVKARLCAAFAGPEPSRARTDAAASREVRIPSWNAPADDRDAEPAGAARKALAVVDISPPGTTQLDEGLEVALAMRNVHLTRDPDAPRAGVLLVVGADIARAEAWLGSARPEPVIVCTTDPSIDTLRRLIAAGASEVQPGPFRLEPLIKRILRATRGACP